jgi:Na+-driven multidrug efflux pump
MGGVGVALFSVIIYLIRGPILQLLDAPESVFPIIDSYWIYWLVSSWTGAMLYFFYSVCRANGNTMLPGTMMIATSLINLVLDPIFIFTLDLGINGAAIATIIAFGVGILFVAPKVTKKHWLTFDWQDLDIGKSVRSIGHIMGPAMISQLLPPISSMLATKLLASYGTAAVAAWALGSRFEFFSIVSVLALTMSMPPMVGRMLGEKNLTDIRSLIKIAASFVLGFQVVIALVTWLFSNGLAGLMTTDNDVTTILNYHLMIVPISLGPLGICMLMVSVSNALGKSYTALTISALRLFAFFLPCLWVGSQVAGIEGLFWGAMVGNILAGTCAWMMYQRALKQVELKLATE